MAWSDFYPDAKTNPIFDELEILRRIGGGGMAEVFLVRDPVLEVQRAIKVIRPEFEGDDKVTHRFLREAKLHAQVQNRPQWVVPILYYRMFQEIPYIVMPYMPAGSLEELVKDHTPLSLNAILKLIFEIANGLTVTEEAGLVHRDIKPSNFLLQDNGYILLSDFGLSTYQEKSVARSVAGTPAYMSPVQFIPAHSQDVRSDIFSLGCTLHFLICARPPFGYKIANVMEGHRQLETGVLPSICRDLPDELLEIRDRALRYDPQQRFQGSQEIADTILDTFGRDRLDQGLEEIKQLVAKTIDSRAKQLGTAWLGETLELKNP